jgi:hypothetical protein
MSLIVKKYETRYSSSSTYHGSSSWYHRRKAKDEARQSCTKFKSSFSMVMYNLTANDTRPYTQPTTKPILINNLNYFFDQQYYRGQPERVCLAKINSMIDNKVPYDTARSSLFNTNKTSNELITFTYNLGSFFYAVFQCG